MFWNVAFVTPQWYTMVVFMDSGGYIMADIFDVFDLIEKDTYTRCKCKKCSYEENVPDFVLDEFAGFQRYIGKKNVVPEVECPKCSKVMVPLKFFK